MNILMLSSTFPYPPTRGGTEIRTFYLLKYLRQRHHITLVTQRDTYVTDTEIAQLRDYVDDLVIFPRPLPSSNFSGIVQKIQRFSTFLIQGTSPNVLNRYSLEMQQWIDKFVESGKCDVITCEHSVNEIYIRPYFKNQVKTIVDVHSSVYATCLNQLTTGTAENKLRDSLYLPLLRRYEQGFCDKFSDIVVTTEEDKLQFQEFSNQQTIPVIPNGVDLDLFPMRNHDPGGYRLIFIGAMDYIANIDAARFFSQEILPEIQKKYPDTVFDIVGSRPVPEVLELQNQPGVNVTGRVPSMVEYLHKSTVCVIPMRTGFGIKNKTLEAMAAGVPVVGSDRGLEGLAVDGETTPLRALRANQPAEYVTAIAQLFEKPELRRELSHHARQLIESEFTWEIAGQRYEQVCVGNRNTI
ncbi:glycosyltransferase family 4 protein [Trichormus variabilis]|uniref:Glycosyl transferase family 1 n=1 Tax=Trichormus variabilis SAG 1403-4b TaxID=447716 RepID=A0A3S1AD97_ANAVA|nr:glycosyltransferase family 4 protein [Trichormus variabilis]MBD2626113.1 glycosyltransferase [Trichormus variabilis FACHB-164]RUS98269.1 glycosyl transferase family 1 [Trichormus variabilis SAG 1403-4b]